MTEELDLLEAIAEAPHDDGPRLVYADWLQQQLEDVTRARGEYVALACAPVKPRPALRIAELLERHEAAWLGPVAGLTHERSWERGFLDRCALRSNLLQGELDAALEHPAWWMVRTLDAVGGSSVIAQDRTTQLICQRALARLRSLRATVALLQRLAETFRVPRITELESIHSAAQVPEVIALLASDSFRHVTKLHLAGLRPAMLPALPAGVRILILHDPVRALGSWRAELAALRSPLAEVRLIGWTAVMFERRSMELVLHGAGGAWNHLEIRWVFDDDARWRDEVLAMLPGLPEGAITRLSFVGPPTTRFDLARFKQRIRAVLPAATVDP